MNKPASTVAPSSFKSLRRTPEFGEFGKTVAFDVSIVQTSSSSST